MWDMVKHEPRWVLGLCVAIYVLGSLACALVLGRIIDQNGDDEE